MISKDQLLYVLSSPHISEKSSFMLEKYNVAVFNVSKKSNKLDIKCAVEELFSVNVHSVRTLHVKGEIVKKHGKNIGKRSSWKKAYVTIASGQKIDFFAKLDNNTKGRKITFS